MKSTVKSLCHINIWWHETCNCGRYAKRRCFDQYFCSLFTWPPRLSQTDVSMLEGDRSHKKSKKRRKTADRSPETTETHTLNKKGTASFVSGIIQLLQSIRWSDCKERHPQAGIICCVVQRCIMGNLRPSLSMHLVQWVGAEVRLRRYLAPL